MKAILNSPGISVAQELTEVNFAMPSFNNNIIMTIQQAYSRLLYSLFDIYDEREASNIANMVVEHITGFSKSQRVMNKTFPFSAGQQERFNHCTAQLLAHKPVQYVLQESWFARMKFFTDENVLIPRPETEELVEWIAATAYMQKKLMPLILDIGTGSGCIAIALKKKLPTANVFAMDISEAALKVAQMNASSNNAQVNFIAGNILEKKFKTELPAFDIIVSNPPYIKQSAGAEMKKNVVDYEPHLALFVPDNNEMIFYEAIAEFSSTHLLRGGELYFEIHEEAAQKVSEILLQHSFPQIEVKRDMQGKERMIRAARNP